MVIKSEIASILKIPESKARYYRDRHLEYLNYIGLGRKRRYKKEALEALRLIAELSKRSLTAEEINNELSAKFNRTIDIEEETAITTAVSY